jgi:hypothetical protein
VTTKSCSYCKHSGVLIGADKTLTSVCRRYPPKCHVIAAAGQKGVQVQTVTVWPGYAEGDWCGEFDAKLN